MKKIIGYLVIAMMLFITTTCFAQCNDDRHLVILSGQSNTGPLYLLLKALRRGIGTDHTIIIKHAYGNTPIAAWDENINGWMYRGLIKKVRKALVENEGYELTSVTFIWAQGAADGRYHREAAYLDSFDNLLYQLKRDLDYEDIRLIIARTVDCAPLARYAKIREIQMFIGDTYPNAVWINVDDLNGPRNTVHLSWLGYKILAERYADTILDDICNVE